MNCDYVKDYYGVPACVGRLVEVDGEPGVIFEDRGNYIGVNFDKDKPEVVFNSHPTWMVVYGGMGTVRRLSKSKIKAKQRYQRFLEFGDSFDDFMHFCRWDAHPDHEWNNC